MPAFRFSFWLLGALGLVLGLAGCWPGKREQLFGLNFEDSTAPLPDWITTEQAHGQYACVAKEDAVYVGLRDFSYQEFDQARRLHLRTRTWLPAGQLKVSVVLQVSRGDSMLFWEDMRLAQLVTRRRQWEVAQRDFTLPAGLLPDDKVSLYLWKITPTREHIYLDDLVIDKYPD